LPIGTYAASANFHQLRDTTFASPPPHSTRAKVAKTGSFFNSLLKRYPHFDPVITTEEGEALANDPVRVAKHTFYPFMHYDQRWTRFGTKGDKGKSKTRLIRYAARSDAYIFSR
jgi:hypothetical protein